MIVKLPGPEQAVPVETANLKKLDIAYCAYCGLPAVLVDLAITDMPVVVHGECVADYEESENG